MKALAPDDKVVTVMVYTDNMLARGDMVAKENARVSILLRTEGAPTYIHLHKPQVISFAGAAPKILSFSEIFIPTAQVTGFHLVPPAQDVLDYDASEGNRIMQPLDVMIGSFILKCKIRISSQSEVATSLEVSHALWLSVYDADISNPYLPQFSMHVPMLLVKSTYVNFGIA